MEDALEMVAIADAAGKRVAGFSLGVGERLGVAAASLGDRRVLILDPSGRS